MLKEWLGEKSNRTSNVVDQDTMGHNVIGKQSTLCVVMWPDVQQKSVIFQ